MTSPEPAIDDRQDPTWLPRRAVAHWPGPRLRVQLGGGLASLAVAVLLFTRFSIYGWLTRDEAIYIYGGQQMWRGVAPYASIMDPKGPISTILCGLGVGIARFFGIGEVLVIRILFLVISVLTALALYLLVVQLWGSVAAGVVSAVVFCAFEGYAHNAIEGPDAKTPGVFFLIIAMWLAVRRNWFWASFAASLAFFTWQPLFPFPAAVLVAAAIYSPGQRRRQTAIALAGLTTPAAILVAYFATEGALSDFINSAFVFPLTGVVRPPESFVDHFRRIVHVVSVGYQFSGVLFWMGVALLLVTASASIACARSARRAALLEPYILVIVVTFLAEAAYACFDFQGFPDLFPLLPYPAIGFASALVLLRERMDNVLLRRGVVAVAFVCAALLTAFSAAWFSSDASGIREEQASACAIERAIARGTPLYVMGDPLPLVLLNRRNPDQYGYLGSGLDQWKIDHTAGGFAGWTRQVRQSRAGVIVVDVWRSPWRLTMEKWLSTHGFSVHYIGPWKVFLTPQARDLMRSRGVEGAGRRRAWPHTTVGTRLTETDCTRSPIV